MIWGTAKELPGWDLVWGARRARMPRQGLNLEQEDAPEESAMEQTIEEGHRLSTGQEGMEWKHVVTLGQ